MRKTTMCIAAVLLFSNVVDAQTPTPAGRLGTPQKQTKAPARVKDTYHPADPSADIEVVRERFDNGDVHIEREVTMDTEGNYIRHGAWTEWSQTGAELAPIMSQVKDIIASEVPQYEALAAEKNSEI